jgi:hypothetical protein
MVQHLVVLCTRIAAYTTPVNLIVSRCWQKNGVIQWSIQWSNAVIPSRCFSTVQAQVQGDEDDDGFFRSGHLELQCRALN